MRRRDTEYGYLTCCPLVLAQRAAVDPSDVNVVLRVDGERLHPLDGFPDDVVGIQVDVVLPFLGLRIEAKQETWHAAFCVLRHPDHAVASDQNLVDVALGMRRQPLLPLSRSWVQLDQPTGDSAVALPDVAVLIEANVLARSMAAEAARGGPGLLELWRIPALARWILGQVVLHVHRLTELRFVQRHFLFRSDRTPLDAGSKVLHEIRDQVCAILARKSEHRALQRKKPLSVRAGIVVHEVSALHVIDPGVPDRFARRGRGEEVFSVAHHADLLRHLFARPWRIDFIVALEGERSGRGRTSDGSGFEIVQR